MASDSLPERSATDLLQETLATRLSRRRVLQFMGLSASAAFIAACSGTAATPAPTAARHPRRPPPAPTPAPSVAAKGGEIRFAPNFEPDSLDPHVASGSSSFIALMNVVETLVILSPDDKNFHPYLADSWTISRRRQGLHVQAPPGRQVPRRRAVQRGGRQVQPRSGHGSGHEVGVRAGPARPLRQVGRGRRSDGRDPHEDHLPAAARLAEPDGAGVHLAGRGRRSSGRTSTRTRSARAS